MRWIFGVEGEHFLNKEMEEDTVFLEDEAKCLVERERCRVDVPGNRRTRVSVE